MSVIHAEHHFREQAFYHLQAEEFLDLWQQYEASDRTIDFSEFVRSKKKHMIEGRDTDFLEAP